MSERILLAVDDSPASRRVLDYVARLVAGRPRQYVHLIHVAPPSERAPGGEGSRALLESMRAALVEAGMDAERVDTGELQVPREGALVEGLIDVGTSQECGTIVVGRSSLPWHRELFHVHPADELVRKARGFTVWVVE